MAAGGCSNRFKSSRTWEWGPHILAHVMFVPSFLSSSFLFLPHHSAWHCYLSHHVFLPLGVCLSLLEILQQSQSLSPFQLVVVTSSTYDRILAPTPLNEEFAHTHDQQKSKSTSKEHRLLSWHICSPSVIHFNHPN
jgi:hypothetical protein